MINRPIVVEVGCGNKPGPFFEGAGEHFAVDAYGPDILEVLLARTEMTPVVADASDLGFDDESVDVVLARNVFGDIALGMRDEDRYAIAWGIKTLIEKEEGGEEALESFAAIEAQAASEKIAIMREAARILVVGGKLIVVEQQTPSVAKRFFDEARQRDDFDLLEVFGIEHNVPLADVTPPNYERVHGGHSHSKLQTWVATKRPGEPADHELPDLGGAGMGQSGVELP